MPQVAIFVCAVHAIPCPQGCPTGWPEGTFVDGSLRQMCRCCAVMRLKKLAQCHVCSCFQIWYALNLSSILAPYVISRVLVLVVTGCSSVFVPSFVSVSLWVYAAEIWFCHVLCQCFCNAQCFCDDCFTALPLQYYCHVF